VRVSRRLPLFGRGSDGSSKRLTRPFAAYFDVVPWRFRYGYRCAKAGCNGHHQTIVDWEIVALWRRVRYRPNWRELMRQKFEQELWDGRDSVLFVGNQEQGPISFLVLGVFWPPDTAYQPRLGL
jgi:hypothetical protein